MKRISRLLRLSYVLLLIALANCMATSGYAQISITPSGNCVVRGSTVVYSIAGPWGGSTNMKWCVTGGIITNNNSTCAQGTPYPTVAVNWSGSSGSITLTTSAGNSSRSITIVNALDAGSYISGNSQQIPYNTVPAPIICSPSTGGSCGSVTYSYQWFQRTTAAWSPISGATGADLSFSGGITETTQYYRRTSTGNGSAETGIATVYITAPLIPGQLSPASQHVFDNEAAAMLTGTPASGGGCAGVYQYWWQWADNINGPYTTINAPPGISFQPPVMSSTKYFRRQVICQPTPETAYSDPIAVYVYPAFTVGELYTISGYTAVSFNNGPGPITGSVSGGMCNGNYQYQWLESTDNSTFTEIQGATAATYTPVNLTQNKWFRRRVTCNGLVRYSTIQITVYALLSITPSSTCIIRGSTQTYSVAPYAATTSMQWCVTGGVITANNSTCISGTPYPSATILWNGAGSTGTITITTSIGNLTQNITIAEPLTAGQFTSGNAQQILYNKIPAPIICAPSTGGGCGSVTYAYQWFQKVGSGNWSPVAGATAPNLSFSSGLTQSTQYFRRTNNSVDTYIASINVSPQLLPGKLSPAVQHVYDNVAADTLKGTPASGGGCAGSGVYLYWWQWADNVNGPFTTINAPPGAWYKPPVLSATKYFRRQVICQPGATDTAYSDTIVVNVHTAFTVGDLSAAATTLAYNTSPGPITGTASGGMCNGNYQYQWQQSTDNVNYTDISGATAAGYTPGNLVNNTWFRRKVTCNELTAHSTIYISVMPPLQAGFIRGQVLNVLVNTDPGIINGTASGGGNCGGNYTYQWQRSVNAGITWNDISNATGADHSPGYQTATTSYRRRTVCSSETAYTNTVTFVVHTSSPETVNRNYIRTRTINKPQLTEEGLGYALTSVNDVLQSTDYYDGLGRLVQQVSKQQGAGTVAKDVVQPLEYDPFGREVKKHMAYASAGTDGNFKPDPLSEQQSYLAGQFNAESYFYTQTKQEAAPNGRVLKTMAPGVSFTGSNRGVDLRYETNVTGEVQNWNVINTGVYLIAAPYATGVLQKLITINEDGKQLIEYKDRENKVILRKIQAADQPFNDHTGWLCTYYVYDHFGNLRLVIQPKAVEWMAQHNNWNINNPTLRAEFCFEYDYDRLNRLAGKRSPGAQWQYLVYDPWDRVILTQDAEQRKAGKWIFTKYDGHDRPIITGFYTDNTHLTQADMQAYADNSIATLSRFEIRDDTKPNGYTTDRSFPVLTAPEYLSVAWFDNYTWCAAQGVNSSKDNGFDSKLPAASNTVYPYAQPLIQSSRVRGLQTGIKYYLLNGSGQANVSVHFYDDNGRIIQTQNKHFAGGTDILTTQYDFSGKTIATHLRHQKGSPNAQVHEVITLNTYNPTGQVTSIEKRLISSIANTKAQQTIAVYAYNDLGARNNKKLGLAANPVETQDYEYNVRGWMTGINKDFVSGANTAKYFGLELGYDKATAAAQGTSYQNLRYNGNVSGAIWRSKGDGIARKYDYLYDNPNRLIRANFTQNTSGASWTNSAVDFSVYGAPQHNNNIGYDANGNILSLYQNAFTLTTSRAIDKLSYTYLNNGESNKLQAVTEDSSIGATRHKLGDFTDLNRSTDDYSYDDNGNLITDKNKRISGIAYNHLNLPRLITFTDSAGAIRGTIEYVYDAGGNKLIKKVNETGHATRIFQYIGGTLYDNDTLQLIAHEEGRIRYVKPVTGAPGNYEFDYFLQDNLGNTRMVLTEEVQTDPYVLLSYEGAEGTLPVQLQDVQYENRTGNSIAVTSTRTAWPAAYNTYNSPVAGETNDYAMLVQRSSGAIGAAKLLKVMAGDRIHTRVDYWYDVVNANNSGADARQSIVTSLLAALGISNKPSGLVKDAAGMVTGALNNDGALLSFLSAAPAGSGPNQAPKAYLNVVFFNEQLQFDQASSRIFPVEYISDHVKRSINKFMGDAITAEKNGYAYVYFSNESNEPVYFDNFQITHERGKILEETHYYPFGGRLEALCSQAYGKLPNQYQFGGKELQSDEFDPASDPDGLQWLDFGARMYDPQIGRWHTPDPMADEMRRWSPYNYAYDNPVRFTDPDGMWPDDSYDEGIPKWARHLTNYALSQIHADGVPRMVGTENMSEQQAQQWINYWIASYANSPAIPYLRAVDGFFRAVPEIAASFLPFVDAYNAAAEGDYAMAGVYLGIDLAGGSLEKGAGKLTMKVAEKFAVKQVEKQVMQEAVQLTSHSIADDIVESVVEYEQYALRAADDGWYPVMKRGHAEPVDLIELRKGDVWKYGTTKNPETRYPQSFLDNTGSGLYYHTEFTGTLPEVLKREKQRISDYKNFYGVLPPGNKIIK